MEAVRSRGSKAELLVELALRAAGLRFQKQFDLVGRPLCCAPETARISVNGCFWHGHHCRTSIPRTNRAYWISKIATNKSRLPDKTCVKSVRVVGCNDLGMPSSNQPCSYSLRSTRPSSVRRENPTAAASVSLENLQIISSMRWLSLTPRLSVVILYSGF